MANGVERKSECKLGAKAAFPAYQIEAKLLLSSPTPSFRVKERVAWIGARGHSLSDRAWGISASNAEGSRVKFSRFFF